MNVSSERIKTKALILSGLPANAVSPTIASILPCSLDLQSDKQNGEQIMQSAAEYILAYLDLGFSYMEHKDIFDLVLTAVGYTTDKLDAFKKRNKEMICNKSRLGSLLGRWPKSAHNSHTKAQAIEEILRLVETMAAGEYRFFVSKKEGSYITMFVLQIAEGSAVLHDVFNNKFYRLIK